MQVLLSHGYFLYEDPKEQKIMRPYPPLGLLYVSAWIEKNGFPNRVLDSTFMKIGDWKEVVLQAKPDVLALYVNLMTKVPLIRLIKWAREVLPATKIVLGGPDITYNVVAYLQTGCDFVVIGEGEQSMLELLRALQNGSSLLEVDGIAFLDPAGDLVRSAPRSKMKDLNQLPMPAREKIDLEKYLDTWRQFHRGSSISINTQRGCPYTCKWCSTAVYGQSYRRRSPQHVLEELQHLIKTYQPDHFWFVDDVFTVSHKWLHEFAGILKKANLSISFECITRADRLNEEVLDLLKQMGCFRVWIGAESGSQKIIDRMDRRVDVTKVESMIQASKARGIQAGTFIMLGYPGETEADIYDTVQYLKAADPDHFTITVAYPIKGTSLFQEVESTLSNEDGNWEQSTDRERDFQRTYRRPYYDHAVRWVTSAVNLHKLNGAPWYDKRKLLLGSKVFYSKMGMLWQKIRS